MVPSTIRVDLLILVFSENVPLNTQHLLDYFYFGC